MIDEITVFTKGGVVLWSRQPDPSNPPGRPIDQLVQHTLLEEVP
jgi:hypothetical protein